MSNERIIESWLSVVYKALKKDLKDADINNVSFSIIDVVIPSPFSSPSSPSLLSFFLFPIIVCLTADTRKNLVASQDCIGFDIIWPKVSSGPSARPFPPLFSNGIMPRVLTFRFATSSAHRHWPLPSCKKCEGSLSRAKGESRHHVHARGFPLLLQSGDSVHSWKSQNSFENLF